jgi:hypothetical protein
VPHGARCMYYAGHFSLVDSCGATKDSNKYPCLGRHGKRIPLNGSQWLSVHHTTIVEKPYEIV